MTFSLEAVKRAGPVAVLGLIALIVVSHLVNENAALRTELYATNEHANLMLDTWLKHLDRDSLEGK